MPFNITQPARFWALLVAGVIGVTLISLSIHVVMLQVLAVPFPDRSGVRGWATFLNVAITVIAFSTFYDLAEPQVTSWPSWLRWLCMAAVFGTLKEVFRSSLMNGVVTTAWLFSFTQVLAPLSYSLILSVFVVFIFPQVWSAMFRIAAVVSVALVMTFAVKPLISLMLAPLMEAVSSYNHADVYPFPYGLHVLVWAYITYLEPVLACFVAAVLVLPSLAANPITRIAQFSALILCIKGALIPTLLFGFFNKSGLEIGMLSESQFLLEGLALTILVAAICHSLSAKADTGLRPD